MLGGIRMTTTIECRRAAAAAAAAAASAVGQFVAEFHKFTSPTKVQCGLHSLQSLLYSFEQAH